MITNNLISFFVFKASKIYKCFPSVTYLFTLSGIIC